jgi:hypothetical protein
MDRRRFGQLTALFALGATLPRMALAGEWEAVLAEAQGQTVYWLSLIHI